MLFVAVVTEIKVWLGLQRGNERVEAGMADNGDIGDRNAKYVLLDKLQ